MLLKDYVPFFISNIDEFKKIYSTQQIEIDKLNLDAKDLLDQCFITSATWGLSYWEQFVGINSNLNKSFEERKSAVLAKLRGTGTTTKEVIKQVARAYFDTDKIEVTENYKEYEFIISIDWNDDSKFGDLENSIEEIKPAHLNFKFALNKSENININTDFKAYEYKLNMCGTFNCGTVPEFSNRGITLNENLNVNSNSQNWIQKYKMCGGKSIDN